MPIISRFVVNGTTYDLGFGGVNVKDVIDRAEAATGLIGDSVDIIDGINRDVASLRTAYQPVLDMYNASPVKNLDTVVDTRFAQLLENEYPIAVSNGGTGARSADEARKNLGALNLFYHDVEIDSMTINTNGGATLTWGWAGASGDYYDADEAKQNFFGAQIMNAWPKQAWTNGAMVNIVTVRTNEQNHDNVEVHLTTSFTQLYEVTVRFFFYF